MTGEAGSRFGPVRRAWQWLWRSDAKRELQRSTLAVTARTTELYRRARLADELGRRMLDDARASDPLVSAHAAELFRQSVGWVLLALESALPDGKPEPARGGEVPLSGPSGQALASIVGDPAFLPALEPLVASSGFVRYAKMPDAERKDAAVTLRRLVRQLLLAVEAPQAALDRLRRRRTILVGLLVVSAATAFAVATVGAEQREVMRDLARDRPWKASSHLMGGCTSPTQRCPESPTYFFHTQEDDKPWLVIDLGTESRFSSLRIQNRIDCCAERAIPLAVEVSSNQKKWKQVAIQKNEFEVWKPRFKTEKARYVRLRSMTKTWLHLHSVRVLP
jgi:hypothetical protein